NKYVLMAGFFFSIVILEFHGTLSGSVSQQATPRQIRSEVNHEPGHASYLGPRGRPCSGRTRRRQKWPQGSGGARLASHGGRGAGAQGEGSAFQDEGDICR